MMHNFKKIFLLLTAIVIGCTDNNKKSIPSADADYLNPNISIEKRVNDLMQRMTLEEKVFQMNQFVGLDHMREAEQDLTEEELHSNDAQGFYKGLFSDDVAAMCARGEIGSFLHVLTAEEANLLQDLALQSRLKIPVLIGIDAIHGNALVSGTTVYPSPITLASTWEDSFLEKVGRQSAIEMRATGSHWTFTPNIDVLRDPRWGRVGETFGEDPLLVGNLGVAMIKGFQQGDYTGTEKVIACAKHMLGGGQPSNGLNAAPFDVSLRTMKEVYLPPYYKAIKAGVYSIMAAHNEISGIPSHMSHWLMTDLFRNEWGFDGFYVSDWMDIERLETVHHVAKDMKEACKLSVAAGMDMHMHGVNFPEAVVALVKEGKLPLSRIDAACKKILTAKFKLGLFEHRKVDLSKISQKIFTKTHTKTALEAARKGIVLLKNEGVLPLSQSLGNKSIFVTGPNANNQSILGDWHAVQPDENTTTIYEGIRDMAALKGYKVNYYDSGQNIRKIKEASIQTAAIKAAQSDIAVVVVGDNSMRYKWKDKTAGENMGRAYLNLAGKQLELVKAIHKTGTQLIVILVNGKPISEPWLQENVPAIVEAWEPGSLGGQAVAEVLFGVVNPSGKLPLTVARSVGQLQQFYNHKPSIGFHTYAFEKMQPLYPFGYGLSYTKFHLGSPEVEGKLTNTSSELKVSVTIQNTGKRAGEEVVQLYIRDAVSSVTRPVKELKGYQRIFLDVGMSKEVVFTIKAEDLAFYDIDMKYCVEPGVFKIMTGTSSDSKTLKETSLEVHDRIDIKL
ncbi:MAG: glycoside hydrolase family 3 N-terminal domain-containing protein [Flavicella sp.]